MGGIGGLWGWQWLFILEGIVPIALGLATMALLPDHPSTCRWGARRAAVLVMF